MKIMLFVLLLSTQIFAQFYSPHTGDRLDSAIVNATRGRIEGLVHDTADVLRGEIASMIATTAVRNISSIASLQALTDESGVVNVGGYYTDGDGGGGIFYWDGSSTATPDSGTIVKSTSAIGRWIRIMEGNIRKADWYGVKYDSSNCSAYWTNMVAKLPKDVILELHPGGKYFISQATSYYQNFVSLTNLELRGNNAQITTVPANTTNVSPNLSFVSTTTRELSYTGIQIGTAGTHNDLFTGSMVKGQNYITITNPADFSMLERGDMISIGDTSSSYAGVESGGALLIFDQVSNDTMYFQKPAYYPVVDGSISDVRYVKTAKKTATIKDLRIVNASINVAGFENIFVDNVYAYNTSSTIPANQPTTALNIFWGKNISVTNYVGQNYLKSGTGYALAVGEYDVLRIDKFFGYDCRHCITTSSTYSIWGGNEAYVTNSSAYRSKVASDINYPSALFDTHASVHYIEFNNCTTTNTKYAYSLRGENIKLQNCKSFNDKNLMIVSSTVTPSGHNITINNLQADKLNMGLEIGANVHIENLVFNNTDINFTNPTAVTRTILYLNTGIRIDTMRINNSVFNFNAKTDSKGSIFYQVGTTPDTTLIHNFYSQNSTYENFYYGNIARKQLYGNAEFLGDRFINGTNFLWSNPTDSTIAPFSKMLISNCVFDNVDYVINTNVISTIDNFNFINNTVKNYYRALYLNVAKIGKINILGNTFIDKPTSYSSIYAGNSNVQNPEGFLNISSNSFVSDSLNNFFLVLSNGGIGQTVPIMVSNNVFTVRKFQANNFVYAINSNSKLYNNIFRADKLGVATSIIKLAHNTYTEISSNTFAIGSDSTYAVTGISSIETDDSTFIDRNLFTFNSGKTTNKAFNITQSKIVLGDNSFNMPNATAYYNVGTSTVYPVNKINYMPSDSTGLPTGTIYFDTTGNLKRKY